MAKWHTSAGAIGRERLGWIERGWNAGMGEFAVLTGQGKPFAHQEEIAEGGGVIPAHYCPEQIVATPRAAGIFQTEVSGADSVRVI